MSTPNDMITRCPKCATAFRATAQVLKIANGTVRCGSCLHVFDAYSHPAERPNKPATDEQAPQASRESDLSPQEVEAPKEDESWALDLLAQEDTPSEEINLDDDFAPSSTPSHKPELTQEDDTDPLSNDSLFIDIINNDLEQESTLSPPSFENIDNTPPNQPRRQPVFHLADGDIDELERPLDDDELPDNTRLDTKEGVLEAPPLNHIEMGQYEEPAPKRWPWLLGALLMGLTLAIQFAWLRVDTLSHQTAYRPYYEQLCKLLKCTLPLASDLDKIRTSHLVVRSDPNRQGILVADAIIINEANFVQAFPALQLEFRDINNQLIARRSFQPHEYLKGELLDATIMPIQQGIQLSLALVDPGANAVNYQINTVAAKVQN